MAHTNGRYIRNMIGVAMSSRVGMGLKKHPQLRYTPQAGSIIMFVKGRNMQHSGHVGQNGFMDVIYSKSLVRAIGKSIMHEMYIKYHLKPIWPCGASRCA